jgi:hypothetical protein
MAAMDAVMLYERELGYTPRDVSRDNRHFDIESEIPISHRLVDGHSLRFIEVKGRVKGADTITVTKNEILAAFNSPEQQILAIVTVDGDYRLVTYLKKPFREKPGFAMTSINYNIEELLKGSEIVGRKTIFLK